MISICPVVKHYFQQFLFCPKLIFRGVLFSMFFMGQLFMTNSIAESFPGMLTFNNGKMTAKIKSRPLNEVMTQISKISKARVEWRDEERSTPVSVEFKNLTFPKALSHILKEKDFMLVYSFNNITGEEIPKILIYPKGQADRQTASSTQNGVTVSDSINISSLQAQAAIDSNDADPAPDLLTIPEPAPTEQNVDDLMDISLTSEKAYSRLDAVSEMAGYAKEDSRVKGILSGIAENDENKEVREAAIELLENMK
jgi:hypothetical protein